MPELDAILKTLVDRTGSDLHLKVSRPPMFRIAGELVPSEYPPVSAEDMARMLRSLCGETGFNTFQEKLEHDTSYALEGVARFRVNAFHQMKDMGAVLRVIPFEVPSIDGLGLPPVLKDIVAQPQGLVLVTGPTGSGKSTTLAAMINHVNETQPLHVITIEDPVEFVYADKMCTINQRQLGQDVLSLNEALRRALRQDPDVILLGEMRDRETIELATHAAETGHLVFSTLHTNDAKQTVDRILDSFPGDMLRQIRGVLSLSLRAVISQRLVKRADGSGRAAALEILVNSPHVRELLAEGKTHDIDKAMRTAGAHYRMQTFNQALASLVHSNVITEQEAMATSASPQDLQLLLRGIVKGGAMVSSQVTPATAAPAPAVEQPAAEEQPSRPKITKGFNF